MTEKTIYTERNVDIWLEDGFVYVSNQNSYDSAASVPAADFFSAVEDFLTLNSALIWGDER